LAEDTAPFFPSRLLCLDSEACGSNSSQIRLVHSDNHFVGTEKYATLSHRWGNLDLIKLLKNNILSFESYIEFDKLPKTFCDAM
jgi:hypothetical protein